MKCSTNKSSATWTRPTHPPLEGRRHAAVAITIVDSDPVLHDGEQPLEPEFSDMSVPGDVEDSTVDGWGCWRSSIHALPPSISTPAAIPHNGRYREVESMKVRPSRGCLRELHEELGLELEPSATRVA